MSRNIHFAEGEFYHLFNRGNDKRVIFRDKADKTRFQKLLKSSLICLISEYNSFIITPIKKMIKFSLSKMNVSTHDYIITIPTLFSRSSLENNVLRKDDQRATFFNDSL